jgi:hypothetical protein
MKKMMKPALREMFSMNGTCAAPPDRRTRIPGELNEIKDDPLSRAQILASIQAAQRLRLPTGEVLRAVRRQIDQD